MTIDNSLYNLYSKPILELENGLNDIFKNYFNIDKKLLLEIGDKYEIHFGPLIIQLNFSYERNKDYFDVKFSKIIYRYKDNEIFISKSSNIISDLPDLYSKVLHEFTSTKFPKKAFYNDIKIIYKVFISEIVKLLKLDIKHLLDEKYFRAVDVNESKFIPIVEIPLIKGYIDYSRNTRNLSGDHDYDFNHTLSTKFKISETIKANKYFSESLIDIVQSIRLSYLTTEKDCLKSEIYYIVGKDYFKEYYSFNLSSYFYKCLIEFNEIEESEIELNKIYKKQEEERIKKQKRLKGASYSEKKIDLSQFSKSKDLSDINKLSMKNEGSIQNSNVNKPKDLSRQEKKIIKIEDFISKFEIENNLNNSFISLDYNNSLILHNRIIIIYLILDRGVFSLIEYLNNIKKSRSVIYDFIFNIFCCFAVDSYNNLSAKSFYKLNERYYFSKLENELFYRKDIFSNNKFIDYLLNFIPVNEFIPSIDNYELLITSIYKTLISCGLDNNYNSKLFPLIADFVINNKKAL